MTCRKAEITDITVLNRISVTSKRHWGYPGMDRELERGSHFDSK